MALHRVNRYGPTSSEWLTLWARVLSDEPEPHLSKLPLPEPVTGHLLLLVPMTFVLSPIHPDWSLPHWRQPQASLLGPQSLF